MSKSLRRPGEKEEKILTVLFNRLTYSLTWARRSQAMATATRHSINNDICQFLSDSKGFRVNFLAERDSLWHLTPELPEGIDHYTTMESLHQLLGDGIAISDISKYTPREKLVLCYTLANSMLFLYPGSWFQTAWSSNRVYFVRRVSSATSSVLTFPYLSVELRQAQKVSKNPPHHMQCHSHPVILALGIIFLEIATGARFTRRSHDQEEWKQYNSDCQQAWQQLQELEKQSERDRSKRISPALKKAIRSCLKLAPPADLLSNTLSEEGPIRLYILSCIVQPLALELRDGYKVRLEELHDALVPEKDVENLNESGEKRLGSTRRRPSSTARDLALATIRGMALLFLPLPLFRLDVILSLNFQKMPNQHFPRDASSACLGTGNSQSMKTSGKFQQCL
jgi:hypothetical protein